MNIPTTRRRARVNTVVLKTVRPADHHAEAVENIRVRRTRERNARF